nr:PREDICTED: immunoglobulin superfamily member 8 [Latimeria chalumnae]|eukprot:XP_014345902.1 PREDICTED: immunoglobulin superfamily member 8 [Latimeria chalumnae]
MGTSASFFSLLILTALSAAREVKVPTGPLYRVAGTAISIPCNVTDYEGQHHQDFEWFHYLPEKPEIPIGIASTKNEQFPYVAFSSRVTSGEIRIHRLRDNAVELKIGKLRQGDTGEFECYTPSTDPTYKGTYSDKVQIKVIPDILRVGTGHSRRTNPKSHSVTESQGIELTCHAQANSEQHTHLSVSFGVSKTDPDLESTPGQEVIAIKRDFTVVPGSTGSFGTRYRNGELHVEKAQGDKYKMVIQRARPEDQGFYYCTAAEWILDPEGNWQKIVEKTATLAQITVLPVANLLTISDKPFKTLVNSGEAMELFCDVTGVSSTPNVAFSVQWELKSKQDSPTEQLVVGLDHDGVVTLGKGFRNQNGARAISLERVREDSYRLRIQSSQPSDLGTYYCIVCAHVKYPNGTMLEVAQKKSEGVQVIMKTEAVSLQAHARIAHFSIYRGDTIELLCNITLQTAQTVHMGVAWWVEAKEDGTQGHLLGTLNRDGVTELAKLQGKDISVDKVGPQCYRLRIYRAQESDQGEYHCSVTAWVPYPDHSWYNAATVKSKSVKVSLYMHAMDTLFVPLIVGTCSALFVGIAIITTVTCCFLKKLAKRSGLRKKP